MKKVLFVLLLVAVLIGSFVSCKEEPAHEHTWDAGKITTPATCEKAGVKTYTCECGETKTEEIPALGHNWDAGVANPAATCEQAGTKVFTCQNDNTHTKTESIPALGHNWDAGTQTTPPTCGVAGVKTYTCQNDSKHTKTESIPATGEHTWGEWENTTPATCEDAGEKTATCSACETTKTEPIPALGHNWDAGVVSPEPTETTDGLKTYTCQNDNTHTKTETIPKLAICASTFAEFEQAFTDIKAEGETRKIICLTADIAWDETKYDGTTAEKTFSPDMTGLTLNLNGHTISGVAKNAFNLTGDSFTLKNGFITGNEANNRYSININYNGTNASTSNGLKEAALAATPAAYTEEDAVWAKRIKVENISATAMLCGYCTVEIKDCSFLGGKYRGLVMQGASGIVENLTILTAENAESAGFVAHSYGTVLLKGTCSIKSKFGLYAAVCGTMNIDASADVTASAFATYALYIETQGVINVKAGATLKCEPYSGKKDIYMRKGSILNIEAGTTIKDSTGAEFAKPIPAASIDSSGNGATDSAMPGYGVAPAINDSRT